MLENCILPMNARIPLGMATGLALAWMWPQGIHDSVYLADGGNSTGGHGAEGPALTRLEAPRTSEESRHGNPDHCREPILLAVEDGGNHNGGNGPPHPGQSPDESGTC